MVSARMRQAVSISTEPHSRGPSFNCRRRSVVTVCRAKGCFFCLFCQPGETSSALRLPFRAPDLPIYRAQRIIAVASPGQRPDVIVIGRCHTYYVTPLCGYSNKFNQLLCSFFPQSCHSSRLRSLHISCSLLSPAPPCLTVIPASSPLSRRPRRATRRAVSPVCISPASLWSWVVNPSSVGACIVSKDGKILGRGHNMRIQKGSATLHVSPRAGGGRVADCRAIKKK